MAPTKDLQPAVKGQGRRASRSIALDLDGTLVDARWRQVGVAREALAAVTGARLDERRFWRAKRSGASTSGALRRLGWSDDVAEEVARRWGERIEADEWLDQDRALAGVTRALARWREAGAAVTVITARRRSEGARRSVAAAGLQELVDDLVVVSPAVASSAKADVLRGRSLGGFIGDTDSDGQAARRAGVAFVAVSTGQRTRGYLHQRGHLVAPSLSAALGLLGGGREISAAHGDTAALSAIGPPPRI